MDFPSFFAGFIVCMVCDVVFSVCSFFIARALNYKARNKVLKEQEKLIELRFNDPRSSFK